MSMHVPNITIWNPKVDKKTPFISFAVNDLSRFNLKHCEPHWKAVKRVFRYLRGTMDYKLTYKSDAEMHLSIYTDADWGSESDSRRSCSGYAVMLAGGAVGWQSKRQPIIALSSTEAEYIALSSAVKEALWMRQLMMEVDEIEGPTMVYCDNKSAIELGSKEAYRPRSKHIDLRYHHIREQIENKQINLMHVGTEEMIADSLTKAVYGGKTYYCAAHMGLIGDCS